MSAPEDSPRPDYWPANQPPDSQTAWARFANSDREAGFEIGPDFERFSQRNDMFNRAQWDEAVKTPQVREFYKASTAISSRRGDGFRQRDYALRNASWAVAHLIAERGHAQGKREGFLDPIEPQRPKAAEKLKIESSEALTAEIKKVARLFGADLVGIAEYDERWVYSHRTDIKTREERPNDLPSGLTHVIIIGHEMDYELLKAVPSATGSAAIGAGYSHETVTSMQIAQYIRNLGYEALASLNDTALTIPFAIKAGMGEYGRNQMVITPEFGPRARFSKILTDLPLVADKPQRFGVFEFCSICDRCATHCPSKALPKGPPTDAGPNRSSIKGVRKWTADCEKCFAYWTRMRTDCSLYMRVCPYNRDYSRLSAKLFRWLAQGRLRRLALWLDDKLGTNAKRLKPSDWWGHEGGLSEEQAAAKPAGN